MLINDADEDFRIGLIAPYRAQADGVFGKYSENIRKFSK